LGAMAAGAMTQPEANALAAYPYSGTKGLILGLPLVAGLVSMLRMPRPAKAAVLFVGAHLPAWLLISGIGGFEGTALAPYYLVLGATWLLGWRCVAELSGLRPASRAVDNLLKLIVPAIFGAWILILWEAVTRGA